MSSATIYMLAGGCLWLLGLLGLLVIRETVRRIIAINLMGSGVFLILVAQGYESRDPVLQALVVTGLVVAVSATAFALRLRNAQMAHQHSAEEDDQ